MADFGKSLIGLGLVLVVVGALVMVAGQWGVSWTNLPLGRLPGDVVYRGKNTTVYFPLATSVVVSVVLTVVLYLVGRWRK